MDKQLILVSSVTYAIKGKNVLYKHGIKSYIERVPKTKQTGCGYGLYVPIRTDEAEHMLKQYRIRILGRLEHDDGGGK